MGDRMLSVADAAIRLKLDYRSAYGRALRGDFGRVERRGRLLFVERSAVERQAPRETVSRRRAPISRGSPRCP
jgi:hypothetical protein